MFELMGKVALVTGASGGIGSAIAQTLVAQGAKVALGGTRQDTLDRLVVECGENTLSFAQKLDTPDGPRTLLSRVEEIWGPVDILVNNAGITRDTLLMRMTDDQWDDVLRVNLTCTFHLCREAIRGMMKRRWGRIINISSVVGTMGNAGQANYAASKAGLEGFSKSLACEVASRGITVNCVAPGFIETPMTDVLSPEHKDKLLHTIPLGRIGKPQEVAASVAFLASEEAAYITGTTLHVNGGLLRV